MLSTSSARLAFAVIVCLAVCVPVAWTFSSGAPDGACNDMVPQHLVPPQKSAAPYNIIVKKKEGSSSVHVLTIVGKGAQNVIKGFMVQAKQNGKLVGKFVVSKSDKQAKYLRCNGVARVSIQNAWMSRCIRKKFAYWLIDSNDKIL